MGRDIFCNTWHGHQQVYLNQIHLLLYFGCMDNFRQYYGCMQDQSIPGVFLSEKPCCIISRAYIPAVLCWRKMLRRYFSEIIWSSHKPWSLLCHICWSSPTATHDWVPVVLGKSWRVPHVGQEMLTLSGTPDFTSIGSSWFHPIIRYTLLNLLVLGLCLQINDWLVCLN